MTQTITGKIVHEPIEGGIWGILADNGKPYRPVNGLPAEFQSEGLAVEAEIKRSQSVSVYMWGIAVELLAIREK